jgi:hypothetical protein
VVANNVLWRTGIILKANVINLFLSSFLFVFWYHSPNFFGKQGLYTRFCYRLQKRPFLTVSRSFDERCQQCVVKDRDHFKGLYNYCVCNFLFSGTIHRTFGRVVYIGYKCFYVCEKKLNYTILKQTLSYI